MSSEVPGDSNVLGFSGVALKLDHFLLAVSLLPSPGSLVFAFSILLIQLPSILLLSTPVLLKCGLLCTLHTHSMSFRVYASLFLYFHFLVAFLEEGGIFGGRFSLPFFLKIE